MPFASSPAVSKKNISLEKAIELLASCAAVQVDGSSLVYPQVLDENDDGTFLQLESSAGTELFAEAVNQDVGVTNEGALVLVNTRGELTVLFLLAITPIA